MPRREPDPGIGLGRGAVFNLRVHLVSSPNTAGQVLTDTMLARREQLLRGVCATPASSCASPNGQTDHVHITIDYPPSIALSVLVNQLMGLSSRRLRLQYPADVWKYLWGTHF
jgi:putative transposase